MQVSHRISRAAIAGIVAAAIGAGAAGGLALLIGVGGTTYRRRHPHEGGARGA
jgi:hypothetical protein